MKKINIVIPTYNRPDYLKRILSYYKSNEEDYQFVIADSSSEENIKKNKDIISSCSEYDILYPRQYPSEMNMFYKLADALHYTKEDYCVICADDDFITPSGIKKSVQFLEKNPDFSCAHGNYIGFYTKTNNHGKKEFYWNPTYISDSITSSKPEERLYIHLSTYAVATFYAVHQTPFLKMIFDDTIRYTDAEDDGQFGEILPSMLTLVHGKMKRLDGLYCAREVLPTSAGRTSKKFSDFVSEGTYHSKYTRFKECLINHLQNLSDIEAKTASRIIDKAWGKYTKNYHGFITPKISYMMNNMPLSKKLNNNLRHIYREVFRRNIKKKYTGSTGAKEYPLEDCLDDFKKIKEFALKKY